MALNAAWPDRDDDQEGAPSGSEARPGPGVFAWYAQGFSDPLGDRLLLFDNTSGAPLELLRLRPELWQMPGFEIAVRDRAAALSAFDDARHARVCRVDRLPDPGGGLAIVSNGTQGQRLSEILHLAEQQHLQPGGDIVRRLVAEVVAAIAAFHASGPRMVHGALGPQRLVITADGQLLVTEYVLGSALARVPLERTAFWTRLRLALPTDRMVPTFDQRTDVVQTGTIALALVLGRMLREDEYPGRLTELLSEAHDRLVLGGWGKLSDPFHNWLVRMLHLDAAHAVANGVEARGTLAEVFALDEARVGNGNVVEAFVRACRKPGAVTAIDTSRAGRTAPATRDLPPGDDVAHGADSLSLAALDETFEHHELVTASQPAANALPPLPATPPQLPPGPGPETSGWKRKAMALLAVVAVAETLFLGGRAVFGSRPAVPSTGAVTIDSVPPRATVVADGKPVGVTPLRLDLPAGRHTLELSAGDSRRTIAVTTAAGTTVSHHVELAPAAPQTQTGKLRIVTAPTGGRILVDGKLQGVSPLLVSDLSVGTHEVVVEGRERSVKHTVDVDANSTASLFVPLPGASAPAPGWLSIAAPLDLNVYEDGELLGTSQSARIMLPAGQHELQLVAESVGFRAIREVQVPVGKTVTLEVTMPMGRIDINALPWAEVLIDNKRVGETPLSGITVPVGRHVVTFRHPQFGERSADCVVTLQTPARVSVDLRK